MMHLGASFIFDINDLQNQKNCIASQRKIVFNLENKDVKVVVVQSF